MSNLNIEEVRREYLRRRLADAASGKRVQQTLARADRDAPLVLSSGQQRLWFLCQFDRAASKAYHMSAALRLRGALRCDVLRQALNILVARHESLRTTFVQQGESAFQVIGNGDAGFTLREQDLRDVPAAQQESAVSQACQAIAEEYFDLEHGPLIRSCLLTLADDEWLLVVAQHHIISDGWSRGVFVREFSALYEALCRGQADPLPSLGAQYADYAAWQREWLRGPERTAQADFWLQHLVGAPALLTLPLDRPRPSSPDFMGACVSFTLTVSLSRALKELAPVHGTTLFGVLLAGWAVLLSRLSGQSDVVTGVPVANRRLRETEGLIGFFVNTLALRVRLDDDPTIAQLLAQTKETTVACFSRQDLPFEQVVDVLKPERNTRHSPVFQVMLSLNNTPAGSLQLPDVSLTDVPLPHPTSHFDLSLVLEENGEHIAGVFEYASALFDGATVSRFVRYFETILAGMVADAQQTVSRLPLLDEAGLAQLAGFNATARDYRADLVHELFEEQAARDGTATALVCGDERLSYAQLDEQANRLAHHLRTLGIGPDKRVAICVERGVEMVVGLLAILKAGGAYVPLDSAYPAERLAFMARDSGAVALLTDGRPLTFDTGATPVLDLRHGGQAWAGEARCKIAPTDIGLLPTSLAYVIYTSGSTGQPKGVMVEHRGVTNLTAAQIGEFAIDASSRVLQFASFSFDACVSEVMTTLCAGATLILGTPGEILAGPALLNLLRVHQVSHATLPPAVLAALPPDAMLEPLQTLVVAGEACPAALVRRFGSGRRFINAYGPTESTVCATMHLCGVAEQASALPPQIGRPIANARVYVLDRHGQPVPTGVAGELYIGGAGVARGYLNRPELTAERFLDDPFVPGGRMYRTGDLGRYLEDGCLEFIGRNDFQVKIRGYRIEAGEIESRLMEHPEVREAAVLAREDVPGQTRLVAYVVAASDEPIDPVVLRTHLAAMLPAYMLPAAFVSLAALPLTPNGKLDRKALPAPDGTAVAVHEYASPLGAAEEAIAAIWQELLGVEKVGRYDHFFELGGHSLMVVSMLERLRQKGWHGDVRAVFAAPTVAALGATLSSQAQLTHEVPPNGIPEDSTEITPEMLPLVALTQPQIEQVVASVPGGAANAQDIYPLTPLQEGILFHHLLGGEGDAYLMRTLLSFDTAARMDAFLAVLQQVIDRHDILRSGVQWQGLPRPVQVVCRAAPLNIERIAEESDAFERLLAASDPRRMRLDLRQAPLLRAYTAYDRSENKHYLALLNHHMVGDHVTMELLIGEIGLLLQDGASQLPVSQPYRNFIAQTLHDDPAAQEAYFRRRLADVEEPTAPFGLLDVQGSGDDVCEAGAVLEPGLTARLRVVARRYGVSPAVLFHVAWALVLGRCSGRDDVVFGTVLSGRMGGVEGSGAALGLFINTLPIRVQFGDLGVAEVVAAVQQDLSELLVHEQASLAMAQRCSSVTAPAPLFTSLLNYRHSGQAAVDSVTQWDGVTVIDRGERTNYPVVLSVDDHGEQLSLGFQTVGSDPQQLVRYQACAMASLVAALETGGGAALHTLDITDADERERMLRGFNPPPHDYPSRLIHELFEEQAARDGAATALVCGAERLSYAQLNERANRVAHYLRAMGVGPEDLVGLYMERSCALIVGMLGILKAGAAYLPLDPINPRNRIAFMLEDAQPKLVLTQASLSDAIGELPHLALDTDWEAVAAHCAADPQVLVASSNLAYVIYTSGSTGKPKGVQIEHGNVQRLFAATQDWFDFGPADTWTMFHSFAFDFSVWEIWGALVYGGKLVVVQREEAQSPDLFHALLVRERVTVLNQTPSAFQQLIAADAAAGTALALRKVIFGGEALNPAALGPWFAAHGDTMPQLINMYGITETTVHVTYEPLQAACVEQGASIGRPIPDLSVHVLDTHMNPAPIGVAGEMYVGGAGVARGYLNRPELTAEHFIEQQLPDGQSRRLYKSGDGARFLPDGRLEYLGRLDAQVKIRGYRIELGEIEARLLACEGVAEAVVVARGDDSDKRLVAYLVPKADAQLEAAVLRAELARQMAEYMVPSAFVTLDAFPLTPNGKLDRKALPAPDGAALAARAYMAPQGDAEEAIAAIWQELLGVEKVGRHDDFFELGGHSLLAIQLLSSLRQAFGVELTIHELFHRSTVDAIATLISEKQLAQFAAVDVERLSKDIDELSKMELMQLLEEERKLAAAN